MMTKLTKTVPLLMICFLFLAALAGCSPQEQKAEYEYKGELKGELAHGQGKLYDGDVLVYEGSFEEGLISGEGTFYEEGKIKYQGQFEKAQALGQGTIYREGQKFFEGEILENKDGEMKVAGTLYNEAAQPAFRGELRIVNDAVVFPDQGELLYPDGTVWYSGRLEDGDPYGEGTYYTESGDVYLEITAEE